MVADTYTTEFYGNFTEQYLMSVAYLVSEISTKPSKNTSPLQRNLVPRPSLSISKRLGTRLLLNAEFGKIYAFVLFHVD